MQGKLDNSSKKNYLAEVFIKLIALYFLTNKNYLSTYLTLF